MEEQWLYDSPVYPTIFPAALILSCTTRILTVCIMLLHSDRSAGAILIANLEGIT